MAEPPGITPYLNNHYFPMITSPLLAHNPSGLVAPFVIVLLLAPLAYMGICLGGFTIGSIGSWRGFLRVFLSSLFCCLLVFCLLLPATVGLLFIAEPTAPHERPLWLDIGHAILFIPGVLVPLWIGRVFTKLSWLRSILITAGIAGASAITWAVMFLAGVFFAVMSQ